MKLIYFKSIELHGIKCDILDSEFIKFERKHCIV
jgi:hypothetical protein